MLNLEIDAMIQMITLQIDSGIPVWFSCDINKYIHHTYNILDTNIYDYGLPFNTSFNDMSKADRLDFNDFLCESCNVYRWI